MFGRSWGRTYGDNMTIIMDPTAILLMVYLDEKMWMKKFEWDLRFKPFPLELKLQSAIFIRKNSLDASLLPQSLQNYVYSIDAAHYDTRFCVTKLPLSKMPCGCWYVCRR
jgi:hypothetical protein